MKTHTFPQKKIARVQLTVSTKAREIELLDNKIKSLQDQLHVLLDKRASVELTACAYKRLAERLEAKYSKVEGSNVKQQLAAKFVVKSMSAKKGWLGVEYAVVT